MATLDQILQAIASKVIGKLDKPTPIASTALVAIQPNGSTTTKTMEEVAGDVGDGLASLIVQPVTDGFVYLPTSDGKFAKVAGSAVDANPSVTPF